MIRQFTNKQLEPKPPLFSIQIENERKQKEGNKSWTQIKAKIKFNVNLGQEQIEALWLLLEEFQDVFAWHKGELNNCSIGEHTIYTHGLPPCQMTSRRLSYREEVEVNRQIQTLVNIGKMHKSASKYA